MMKNAQLLFKYLKLSLVLSLLAACALTPPTLPQATETPPQATDRPVVQATQEPAITPRATGTKAQAAQKPTAQATQEAAPFPLSEFGPYHVSRRTFDFEDASRSNRPIEIAIWYPALLPEGSSGAVASMDADPDLSDAPYPLLLSSTKIANVLARNLVSHGFVWVSINRIDTWDQWDTEMIDQPLDLLFALDQVAANPPAGLEGMIDAEHAGALGYSFDGFNSLALSGARVDPEYYLAQCASVPTMQPRPEEWWVKYICNLSGEWDEFVAHAGEALTASEDGPWQPITDERIRAVMPMAPEGAWLFGERGLAAVDRPTLIIGATRDYLNFYNLEAVYIFEHLGTPERAMISFVGQGHMMIFEKEMIARMSHFAVAFFGYYLQGREDYAQYFSEDFVSQHDDLAWGIHMGK